MAETIMMTIITVLLISLIAETLRLGFKKGIFQGFKLLRQVKVWVSAKLSLSFKKTGQCQAYKKASGANEVWNSIWQGRIK